MARIFQTDEYLHDLTDHFLDVLLVGLLLGGALGKDGRALDSALVVARGVGVGVLLVGFGKVAIAIVHC